MVRTSHTDVLVLGAGLTGLSCALELQAHGTGFRLIEKADRVGGHAITIEEDGYRFDRTGHLLHLRDAEIEQQVLGWLPGAYHTIERRSLVWSHGVYTPYPFQANTHGLPPRVVFECVQGFVEAHFAPKRAEPRNFEEYCLAHFGAGISHHFMLPYNSRLWGVPPRDITSDWCHRFVPLPRLEDVIAGAVGHETRQLGYNKTFVYPERGIGALPDAMHRQLGHVAELGTAPHRIDFRRRRAHLRGETIHYEALVSTIPLPRLVSLLDDPPPEVAEAASRLRSTHLHYLDVALASPPRKTFHWVYVPESKYPFYRVGCYTSFSSALAPPGHASLYVELAERAPPNLDTLLESVTAGLIEMGIIQAASDVEFARLRCIDPAYVIYDHAHASSLSVIKPFLGEVGIVAAGRYGDWNYSSMEDALRFGRRATRRALELVDE